MVRRVFLLSVLAVFIATACSHSRSPIDNAFGTSAPHYLLAAGTEHGQPWAFYAGVDNGGSPSIGFSNAIFDGGGVSFLVPDGFTSPDLADGRPLSGTVHGTDGVTQSFDAIVGFAPPNATAIVLRKPGGETERTAAVRVPGISAVRFFVFTGPGITSGEWDLAGYTSSGKLLRAPCPPSKRFPCPSPPPTSIG